MAKENKVGAFLQITMHIKESDRAAAGQFTTSIVSRFWMTSKARIASICLSATTMCKSCTALHP